MKSNIRQAAINAIKEGNLSQLRALKSMIDGDGYIPVYYQVLGELELYKTDGSIAEIKPDSEAIPGLLPNVSSIIVTFATQEDMETTFAPEAIQMEAKQGSEIRRPI